MDTVIEQTHSLNSLKEIWSHKNVVVATKYYEGVKYRTFF
jgi:hypothetical protein